MTMPSSGLLNTFTQVREGLAALGFRDELILHDYEFADILGEEYSVKSVPLAAFTHFPPSYQNACFGVVIPNGYSGLNLVSQYRSLGAHQIFEVSPSRVNRWKMSGSGDPTLIEEVNADQIHSFFQTHMDDWAPLELARVRARQGFAPVQSDFFDRLLLPLLDHEVQRRLDNLLRRTISTSIGEYERREPFLPSMYPALFRLVFRLLAAKTLGDRRHPGNWVQNDPESVVNTVEGFYFQKGEGEPVLRDPATQRVAWDSIRGSFHFQNLSVDALAYVYETTLVSEEARRTLGTHGTPPQIAEFIVRHLPFEDLAESERTVFEPFSGHAVFLTAAMRRLRELLAPSMTSAARHEYFVRMLLGIEVDPFAREVGRLSLMLADYPNPDGWRIYDGNAFTDPRFTEALGTSRVVLCNPPFEAFSHSERTLYHTVESVYKPAAVLLKVMQRPPKMLGFVLPRVALTGSGYRRVRELIADRYSSIEVVALPDTVFQHSEAESVLLIATGQRATRATRLIAGEVYKSDLESFYRMHQLSYQSSEEIIDSPKVLADKPWLLPLKSVWEATSGLETLQDVADVHRGIEYNARLDENRGRFVVAEHTTGFRPGVDNADRVEPYVVRSVVYLNVEEPNMRGGAFRLPWHLPKLIANAIRRTRGHWKLTAAIDAQGLVCYQNLHGVWPRGSVRPEVIAAILNGPLANAFIASKEAQRAIRVATIKSIPIPPLSGGVQQSIANLVNEYRESLKDRSVDSNMKQRAKAKALLEEIDAEVLKAYDLPPKLERLVLDYFSGHKRPGPVDFTEYFPSWFTPYISWAEYLTGVADRASAEATLRRLTPINDPIITQALADIYENEPGL